MSTSDNLYDKDFFDGLAGGALRSAQEVVPVVLDLIPARTCIDVGCARGEWLSVFKEHGLDVAGCDGRYIDRKSLLIPEKSFTAVDLNQPLEFDQAFDLCISLEVAEHLTPEAAPGFIRSLVCLAPCVLFSAAVPDQGGTGHLNEQWPEYWASLFQKHGYVWLDPFRLKIWNNPKVAWWYRQNLFLFCSGRFLNERPDLAEFKASATDLRMVHPEVLQRAIWASSHPKRILRRAGQSAWRRMRGISFWGRKNSSVEAKNSPVQT